MIRAIPQRLLYAWKACYGVTFTSVGRGARKIADAGKEILKKVYWIMTKLYFSEKTNFDILLAK
jgi:hypothetical protein